MFLLVKKGTTRHIQNHARRWGGVCGLRIFPDVRGIRASNENCTHEFVAKLAPLCDDKIISPLPFARMLAARLGHDLNTSRKFYLTAGSSSESEEQERRRSHVLFNTIFKLSYYPEILGGLQGKLPWHGLTGKKRAKKIVEFLI